MFETPFYNTGDISDRRLLGEESSIERRAKLAEMALFHAIHRAGHEVPDLALELERESDGDPHEGYRFLIAWQTQGASQRKVVGL